jgi:hypothetical protein
MFPKAPGVLVFLLSILLALAVLAARMFHSALPFLAGEWLQFYALLAAYVILLLGCTMRGL